MTTKDKSPSRTTAFDPQAVPAAESIQQQVNRILASPEFKATDVQKSFLKFVVETVLDGRPHEIKGYTVATQVFGRGEDFNQATDPIVSIQANKLRRALERYYLVAGQNDPVRIDIPKGTYVPTFVAHELTKTKFDLEALSVASLTRWPLVLIRPFRNLTDNDGLNFMALGLSIELTAELSRYQEVRVLMENPAGHGRRVSDTSARFILEGTIRSDASGMKVVVHLLDAQTGLLVWSDSHNCILEAARLIAFQEKVARVVAVKVGGERGVIFRTLSSEAKNQPPAIFKTYEAILRYYEFELTLSPEHFAQAMAALTYATTIEPGCGHVWSMLARLYANVFSLEIPGFENALEKATQFAQKGINLSPNSQRSRVILAFVRFFQNELSFAKAEIDKALELNPNSLFILDGIGYLMTLMGDWEKGPKLIRYTMAANPYHGLQVHYALWVDWMRQGNYERAYLETLNFKRPAVFWEPLMKAATLGQLERIDEGEAEAAKLVALKPDFKTRGRTLINHYIKFDEIAERIIKGLSKVGVEVDAAIYPSFK